MTTKPATRPASKTEPATEKQIAFLKKLAESNIRYCYGSYYAHEIEPRIKEVFNVFDTSKKLTKRMASKLIDA